MEQPKTIEREKRGADSGAAPGSAYPRRDGMRLEIRGVLIRLARKLHASGKDDEGYNYVLDVFEKHLTTLSVRFYRGDIAAVDEFLQLYNLDQTREDTPNEKLTQDARP